MASLRWPKPGQPHGRAIGVARAFRVHLGPGARPVVGGGLSTLVHDKFSITMVMAGPGD